MSKFSHAHCVESCPFRDSPSVVRGRLVQMLDSNPYKAPKEPGRPGPIRHQPESLPGPLALGAAIISAFFLWKTPGIPPHAALVIILASFMALVWIVSSFRVGGVWNVGLAILSIFVIAAGVFLAFGFE